MSIYHFTDVPIRLGGDKINEDWSNSLRQAGINLESLFGSYIPLQEFALANNQSSPAAITGFLCDSTLATAFFADYEIYRNTTGGGATKLKEVGTLLMSYTPGVSWDFSQPELLQYLNLDSGITFSIDATTGQVKYTSSNITGTADVSRIRFRARAIGTP